MPDQHYETVMADHSLSGLAIEEGETRAMINKAEVACLVMLFAHYGVRRLPVTLFGRKLYVNLRLNDLPIDKAAYPLIKDLRDGQTLSDALTECGWLRLVNALFTQSSGGYQSTPAMQIDVYPEKHGDVRNSTFSVFINRSNGRYFINASCAPTQVLMGGNSLPIGLDADQKHLADKQAKFLTDMFILPFIVVGQLLDKHILQRLNGNKSLVSQAVANGTVSMQKIQVAAYSPEFSNQAERDLALLSLYQVMSARVMRKTSSTSASVADALGMLFDDSFTTFEYDDDRPNDPVRVSGFMLRLLRSRSATFSLGFYAKDIVGRAKDDFKSSNLAFSAPRSSRKLEDQLTSCSIRLDLNIHAEGIRVLSRNLPRIAQMRVDPVDNPNAKSVQRFLQQVLSVDDTLGLIFTYVLKDQLRFDQLFATTAKQWAKAFDMLKEQGLSDLVDLLKNKAHLHRGESFTALVQQVKGTSIDPSRLRHKIIDATRVLDENKRELLPGVDLQFPFRVAQLARRRMTEVYEDPDALEQLYEKGYLPNDYDPVAVGKQARNAARRLYNTLLHGNLRPMPAITVIDAKHV